MSGDSDATAPIAAGDLEQQSSPVAGAPPHTGEARPWTPHQYAFLCPGLIDAATLNWAVQAATYESKAPEDVLIAARYITPEAYEAALLAALHDGAPSHQTARRTGVLESPQSGSPRTDKALRFAVSGLRRASPRFSAANGLWTWQLISLIAMPGLIAGAAIVIQELAIAAALGLLTFVFALVVVLRGLATGIVLTARSHDLELTRLRLSDHELPSYAVIVPVYDEAAIAPDCVRALAALDYPTDRLDVVFAVEADDAATRDALLAAPLPPHMRIVEVPPSQPRTKPKAMNYVLAGLRADYVVIYDAEDVPEANQLRHAAARFHAADGQLGCLQAKLNTYNWRESWIAGQFTLEYSGLFDGFLRALEQARLPIPLGGTSNHFPRQLLQSVGGWDAHNVTEDADLGLRLARLGYRVSVLNSTTWEEAPSRLGVWLRQRSRCIKGWLQTYSVHMREPFRLLRDLGIWRFVGFQLLVGGLLASVFAHPLMYVLVAYELLQPAPFQLPQAPVPAAFWIAAMFNLIAGTAMGLLLAASAVARRGRLWLWLLVPTMPLYWLIISLAGYRALWQVWRKPFDWEKTPHRARTRRERRCSSVSR